MKEALKKLAVDLRKRGLTYSEILAQIPVAKSTLSLWLRSVSLAEKQYQRLTKKKLIAQQKGAAAKHQQRLDLVKRIGEEARQEIQGLDNKHLWLAGVMLYWAEGTKEKEHSISAPTTFNNSDPRMIKLFVKWLIEIMKVPADNIDFSIYIHKTGNVQKSLDFWSETLACDKERIKVYFKKHQPKTNRKNTGDGYYGLLRVAVKKSVNLNRKIAAWTNHICNYWNK